MTPSSVVFFSSEGSFCLCIYPFSYFSVIVLAIEKSANCVMTHAELIIAPKGQVCRLNYSLIFCC